MPAYKDKERGTWMANFYYTNWQGERKRKNKRGFPTKKDALAYERQFLQQTSGDMEMDFTSYAELYLEDVKLTVKESTWEGKVHYVNAKMIPYFGKMKMCDITPKTIMDWHKEMKSVRKPDGEPYKPGYLKTLHNQLSAMFNHAIKFYGLKENPAAKAGNMGHETEEEMKFWTREQYTQFADVMMNQPVAYYGFQLLYWCGLRIGELLALTLTDFDFENHTVRINKTCYRAKGGIDKITEPKTKTSIRTVAMPENVSAEIKEYISHLYGIEKDQRIFPYTKYYFEGRIKRGAKEAGLEQIRVHDLRHSHVSLLISMGFTVVDIAKRVGHKSIYITFKYAHMFPTTQKEMADRLDKEIERSREDGEES